MVELSLILGFIGTVTGSLSTIWLLTNVWVTRHLVKRLNLDISCEQKKAGQENFLIMAVSVENVGGTRVEPQVAKLTITSENVQFFDKTESAWSKELIIDCHEFWDEVVDPNEIIHRGYAVKTKGTGVVDIFFLVTSPRTFLHPKPWTWTYAKCGCV